MIYAFGEYGLIFFGSLNRSRIPRVVCLKCYFPVLIVEEEGFRNVIESKFVMILL